MLHSVGRPNREDLDPGIQLERDQISALFGRWVFAPHGLEIYGEWARFEEPASFRDFLEFPQHSSGYTAGFQWVQASNQDARLRAQVEITNLEPSSTFRHRTPFSSYASQVVPHGYTHKGQVIGSGIGPGASSQWLALDRSFYLERWRIRGPDPMGCGRLANLSCKALGTGGCIYVLGRQRRSRGFGMGTLYGYFPWCTYQLSVPNLYS